jgi:FeS assembly protein IscX
MARVKHEKTITWENVEELAFLLIDQYPKVDPSKLSLNDIGEFVLGLKGFSGTKKGKDESTLKLIQDRWYDERVDMDEEYGEMSALSAETMDEDEFQDDAVFSHDLDPTADKEEPDELDDGFQEEEKP